MLAYRWAGMSWADAFMHMCTTMGLGGFSSHDASFGYWNSPAIEMGGDGVHGAGRHQLLALFHGVAHASGALLRDRRNACLRRVCWRRRRC
jgi:hypothetical protein